MTVFNGTAAAEDFTGGAGFDRIIYRIGTGMTLDLVNPTNSDGFAAGDTYTSIEGFNLAGSGTAIIVGDASAHYFTTGSGNDIIRGGGGGDRISSGAGDDTFQLSAGEDFLHAVFNGGVGYDRVVIDGLNGSTVELSGTVLVNMEEINFATAELTLELETTRYVDLVYGNTAYDSVVIETIGAEEDVTAIFQGLFARGVEYTMYDGGDYLLEGTVNAENSDWLDLRTTDTSPGGLASSLEYRVETFDLEGVLRATETLRDSGVFIQESFDAAGIITSRHNEDRNDVLSYVTADYEYVEGILNHSVVVNDNGVVVTTDYDEFGDRQNVNYEDVADIAAYTSIDDLFYAAADGGGLASRLTTYDAGESQFSTTFFAYNQDGSNAFREFIYQADGHARQIGYDGNDILGFSADGPTNDTFTGGGGNDLFFSFDSSFGRDTITDFDDNGDDVLDLSAYGIFSRDDLDNGVNGSAILQVGAHVEIVLAEGTIVLLNTNLADMGNDDFVGGLILA